MHVDMGAHFFCHQTDIELTMILRLAFNDKQTISKAIKMPRFTFKHCHRLMAEVIFPLRDIPGYPNADRLFGLFPLA